MRLFTGMVHLRMKCTFKMNVQQIQHYMLFLALAVSATARQTQAISIGTESTSKTTTGLPAFQSITEMPGCSSSTRSMSSSRTLTPDLHNCRWKVQTQRQSSRWYAFDVAPDVADNMTVVIMARALSGQITMALWAPGADPYASVPSQIGTNYMGWPGLRETEQAAFAAGGGHASIASEQQYLHLTRKKQHPLLAGQYLMVVTADMGQPLVEIQVSTPSSNTQLESNEQEALKDLVNTCCPVKHTNTTHSSTSTSSSSSWCNNMVHVTRGDTSKQWFADMCHVAPNVCDKEGHLQRLVLPPYALQCSQFPQAVGRFSRLQHLDISYSRAPGTLAEVATVVGKLKHLEELHLRGVGLKGPLSCEIVQSSKQLKTLQLSDNDKLAGTLPSCFFELESLQELQLAGLSQLRGLMPQLSAQNTGSTTDVESSTNQADQSGTTADESSTSSERASNRMLYTKSPQRAAAQQESDTSKVCGFGALQYVNLAGVIGDQEPGLMGPLPALAPCKTLMYLDLSGHALSGTLPSLPASVQFLNLSSNGFSQALPDFSASPQLQYLDLSFNRFSGTLQNMATLHSLDWLDMSDNELAGPLPDFPLSVRWLDLSNNQLSGGLELPVLGQEAERLLVLLNLAGNKLTGPLSPSVTSEAPHLNFLDLSHNSFSETLDAFAAALLPTNQILQINLSYNRFTGTIPPQIQTLAAVRSVMVTMKDGNTPVHRILDLSHNNLQGTFPEWLIRDLPRLIQQCRCTAGVYIDAEAFSCPAQIMQGSFDRRAQEVLRRFQHLQCVITTAGQLQQQTPIWQLTGSGYSYTSREERKQQLAHLAEQQQQQQRRRLGGGAIAGIVIACVAVAVATVAAVMAAVQKYSSNSPSSKAANDTLLHHYDPFQPDHPASCASTNLPSHCPDMHPSSHYSHPGAAHSIPSNSSARRTSQNGDGVCEIALVVKSMTHCDNRCATVVGDTAYGSAANYLSKDGLL